MNLIINTNDSVSEMCSQALDIAKNCKGNFQILVILDKLMNEIKWGMKENQYKDFQDRINELIDEA